MHLIILSALQSAVLNPICFIFFGLGRAVARPGPGSWATDAGPGTVLETRLFDLESSPTRPIGSWREYMRR